LIFNFIDLDKDKNISNDEVEKLIQLIFQLVDVDKNKKITEIEIIELKKMIESLTLR
jgi:hypothetical protein